MAIMTITITMLLLFTIRELQACTGISFKAADGSPLLARTVEWGGSDLMSRYVIVPRGYKHTSLSPDGSEGMTFTSRYGYVGISVTTDIFITEGLNEKGLSAGLFFFPGYGRYSEFNALQRENTIIDMQLVSWILSNFSTIDEVIKAFPTIVVTGLSPEIETVHWRIGDSTGRQVVLEIIDGIPKFYENTVGILTNSPGFEWQLTNLNNYINLRVTSVPSDSSIASYGLKAFGAGSGMFGLPGDITPPSRFIRAFFYTITSPQPSDGHEAAMTSFRILNNFDIPIGFELPPENIPEGLPSATQWTSASDLKALKFYYRTCWNSTIRCIDLSTIDFSKVKYKVKPLDKVRKQSVEMIR